MINGTPITIVGNVGQDPEMRYTPGGNAVVRISVAVPQRRLNKTTGQYEDTGTTWHTVIAWRGLAENVASSIQRGQRVIVIGTIASRDYERGDGSNATAWEVTADAIGPDLSYQTATVRRTTRDTAPMPDDPYQGPGALAAEAAGNGASEPGEHEPASQASEPAQASQGSRSGNRRRAAKPAQTA
jgi:single-strand DNA-binding protein